MRNAVAAVVATAAAAWFLTGARAQVQPVPGPGSGIVTVQGAVSVNGPVEVSQRGKWDVAISNQPEVRINGMPIVRVAGPTFLAPARYVIVWNDGSTETVTVVDAGGGNWVKVGDPAGDQWINLALARSIRRVR